jgi:type IV secretory pathway VirB10-like protein
MPSAGLRLAGETAFLILVALGLWLAEFDPIVIGVVMLVALVLVALLERASSKESARETDAEREPAAEPLAHAELVDVEHVPLEVALDEPEPEPTVSERSARAILASGPPPLPPEPPKPSKPKRRLVERRTEPEAAPQPPPQPEPEPAVQGPAREWNLWELQRAVRDAPDDERHEEWTALLIHLREFANADGDLPIEFDALVRESFADVLASEREPATAS